MDEAKTNELTLPKDSDGPSVGPNVGASPPTALVQYQEGDEYGMAMWDSATNAIRTSIDDSQAEGRRLVSKCIMAADLGIRNAAKQVHEIVGYFCHGVTLKTPIEGELVPKLRLVMIRADGKTISTFSEPCIKAFAYLVRKLGQTPWKETLYIEVVEIPLGGEKSYCNLREVLPPGNEPDKVAQRAKHK